MPLDDTSPSVRFSRQSENHRQAVRLALIFTQLISIAKDVEATHPESYARLKGVSQKLFSVLADIVPDIVTPAPLLAIEKRRAALASSPELDVAQAEALLTEMLAYATLPAGEQGDSLLSLALEIVANESAVVHKNACAAAARG